MINRPTQGSTYNLFSPCPTSLASVLPPEKATSSWRILREVWEEGMLALVKAGRSYVSTVPNYDTGR